ncbi:MAG TPA: HlyD family efflux transporter periplasmic adaptor subunit [Gammaproteobacteria bacterium]|nr:HlyD family efflux transporter periplasmic adaptor subunit [Gammaproteobacteria bacterium]
MIKKKIMLFVPLAVLSVVLLSILFWWDVDRTSDESNLVLYGNIEIREAQLAFNASEHVAAVFVQEGDRVAQGQLLARLHTALLDAQVAEAEAALQAQQHVLARLEAGSRAEEIYKGESELRAARARAKSASDSYKRMAKLLKEKLASPEDVEKTRSLAEVAEAQAASIKHSLALLKLGPRKEDIEAARAQLAVREASLKLARLRQEDARLYAPAKGVIRNRILEPGDMVFPQTPVLTLAFMDPVWVRAYLPETLLGRVKPGVVATIHSDSYPDRQYKGWVGYISPTAEFTPKTVQTPALRTRLVYSVRVFACNPEEQLRLGMPVTVTLALDQVVAADQANHCEP